MSSSALQIAKTATYLPDLVEVQRASFKWFLEKGLIEELKNVAEESSRNAEDLFKFDLIK